MVSVLFLSLSFKFDISLKVFAASRRLSLLSDQESRKAELKARLNELIPNGNPSEKLTACLRSVFSLYCDDPTLNGAINETAASRLWYRCGIQLSNLEQLLEDKSPVTNIEFDDFLQVITDLIDADHRGMSLPVPAAEAPSDEFHPFLQNQPVEVGDVVELLEGFEKFGDAAGGPMTVGDRGQVVEIQTGQYDEP